MRVAALDLGSNTTLMLIADVSESGEIKVIEDFSTVTRLGQGVGHTGTFHSEALKRMEDCLARYASHMKHQGVERVAAVATSAARDARNKEELFEIGAQHGIPIQVVAGGMEAQLTFEGATIDFKDKAGLAVIDVGGGSTEIIFNGKIPTGQSLNVGSVRLTERYIKEDPPKESELNELRACVRAEFEAANFELPPLKQVVAVAGTPTTLACVLQKQNYAQSVAHGFKLTIDAMEDTARQLSQFGLRDRKQVVGLEPERADVIIAGTLILAEAARALGVSSVTTSTKGVRYGVAKEWQKLSQPFKH